jgi:hypothetical protein
MAIRNEQVGKRDQNWMNIRNIVYLCDAYSAGFGPLSLPRSRFRYSPTGSYAEAKAKTLAYKTCKSGMADDE